MSNPRKCKRRRRLTSVAFEVSDFWRRCCSVSSSRKSDQAKNARSNQAVKTLAAQALWKRRASHRRRRRHRVRSTALIAAIDKKLTEQVNQIIHHADFQQAGRRLARLASTSSPTPRPTNNAEDQGLQRLEEGPRQDAQEASRGPPGIKAPLFKKIYEEEYGQFGGEPYGCLVADYHFDHRHRRTSRTAARDDRQDLRRGLAHAHGHRRVAHRRSCRWKVVARTQPIRATSPRSSPRPSTPPGARCGNRKTPSYLGLCHAAVPVADSVRLEDQPRRRVRLRRRNRRGQDHSKLHLDQRRPTPWPTNITRAFKDVRLVHDASAASSRAVRCRRFADAHVPVRRRRRRHEVPDGNRHRRPPRSGIGQVRASCR